MGHGLTVALTRFVDTTIAPPSSPDPVLYRKGLQFFFRDTVGIEHPVAVGADGLGVVSIALADSPYDVQPTDRVLLVNTGDGAVTANLPADGGPFDGRPLLIVDAASNFATNNFTLDGNGQTINGSATLVFSTDDVGSALVWAGSEWIVVAGAGADAIPAAHAASHKAGGSDDLLSAPGVIGGTTPNTVHSSSLYLTSALAAAVASKVQVIENVSSTGAILVGAGGQQRSLEADAASATMVVRNRVIAKQVANGGTYDISIVGKGGRIQVTAVGATSSSSATASFADNGATTFNGVTFTGYSTTLTTPASINIAASSGNVRIENLSGVTVNFLIVVDQLLAV